MEVMPPLIHSLIPDRLYFAVSGHICASSLGFLALRDSCLAERISILHRDADPRLKSLFPLLFLAARGHVCLAVWSVQTFCCAETAAGSQGISGFEPTTCARREAAFKRD